MAQAANTEERAAVPAWLYAFCFALMGSAGAINGAFVALAIPAMAPLGLNGLVMAGGVGAALGIIPGVWLARRIADGIREDDQGPGAERRS